MEADSLWVETMRASSCATCSARKGCGHGLLNQLGSARPNRVRVPLGDHSSGEFALDDQVEIAIPDQLMVRGSFIVYILPLLCMLALAAGLQLLFPTAVADIVGITGAIAGFTLGVGLVRLHAWLHRHDSELQPRLLRSVDVRRVESAGLA